MTADNGRQCHRCSKPLTGRQMKFCGTTCSVAANRNIYLMKTYGITADQFDQLLAFQGGVCYICERPPQGKRIMVVDHEHDGGRSGKVRGILCQICNLKFLGKEKKSNRFHRAAEYLDDPPAVRLFGVIIADGAPAPKRKRRQPRRS